MSVRHRSYRFRCRNCSASKPVPAASTLSPMRVSVIDSSSRMSASSSTTRTRAFIGRESGSDRFDSATFHAEMPSSRRLHVLQRRPVRLAHLAGDVQAKSGAGRDRREERLEQVRAVLRRYARTIVDHAQSYSIGARILIDPDDDAAGVASTIAQGVATQVPHHLIEMAAVEADRGLERHLQPQDLRIDALDTAELLGEGAQKVGNGKVLGERAVAPVELEHILHHAIEPLSVVVDDAQQTVRRVVEARLLLQQLGGMADGRERIADFVSDIGGQPSEGGQLHLTCLGLDAGQVLEEQHRPHTAMATDRYEAYADGLAGDEH